MQREETLSPIFYGVCVICVREIREGKFTSAIYIYVNRQKNFFWSSVKQQKKKLFIVF